MFDEEEFDLRGLRGMRGRGKGGKDHLSKKAQTKKPFINLAGLAQAKEGTFDSMVYLYCHGYNEIS